MKIAHFDCFAGVAGDMTLGALVDLGVDIGLIDAAVRSLGVEGFRLEVSRVDRAGLGGIKVDVRMTSKEPQRNLADIEALLARGSLDQAVRERARLAFRRLAEAESRAHRIAVEEVHFHEVGAVDAIVDVVGSCVGLHALGVERVTSSPVVLGRGMTRGSHGPIPIPAPATLELLRGVPVREGPVEAELTTPTGAAILAAWVESFGAMPEMRVLGAGYGAGTRDFAEVPNLLRIVLGESAGENDLEAGSAVLVEANLDDLSPQVTAHAAKLLLEAGALDVWLTPVIMKKGRPGQVLEVLARPKDLERMLALIFAETTTLGVRSHEVKRRMLARHHEEVATQWGAVGVKVATSGEQVLNAAPEYEDCARLAQASGVPLREVQAEALAAWRAGRAGRENGSTRGRSSR